MRGVLVLFQSGEVRSFPISRHVPSGILMKTGPPESPKYSPSCVPVVTSSIVRASSTRTTLDVTTGTQDGEYFGDSGGPVFINMPDGTWRLIGNDLTSPDWNSTGKPRISTYTSVPYHVAWAEMQSGIDITPCHDASGWNPSASCVGSPINPGEGVGTWATSCAGQTIVLQPTCDGSDGGVRFDASRPIPVPDAAADAR